MINQISKQRQTSRKRKGKGVRYEGERIYRKEGKKK